MNMILHNITRFTIENGDTLEDPHILERGPVRKFDCGLDKFRSLKTGLMQDLLTGKVRVTPLLENQREAVT